MERHLSFEEVQKQWGKARYDIGHIVSSVQNNVKRAPFTWAVLDDDPTGVQSVHDIPVYTRWDRESLNEALSGDRKMFYILTNSRGLTKEETTVLHKELMENLLAEAKKLGREIQVISRSDSTLRGHFPLETDLIGDAYEAHTGKAADGLIMAPFFEAGGRYTIDNVHYVRMGDDLVPAAETEFAKDATFGYKFSDLPSYVEEKTDGRVRKEDVISIPLALLRAGDTDAVTAILKKAQKGQVIIINALESSDLDVFAAALYPALAAGKRFLYRTAADFVRAVGGISVRPLLTREDLLPGVLAGAPGVIVVGSHTKKTTAQLEKLKEVPGLDFIPFDSDKVLTDGLSAEADRVAAEVERDLACGRTAVFFTKRQELILHDDTPEEALRRSVAISEALVSVISKLSKKPAYIVAKGGITSSDVGTKALSVRRALVLGQAGPGIPVWRCGEESRFPGIPYVIFPGNVGSEESLADVVRCLQGGRKD
ncbi:MAG: four-carbon acid sugar kinase family protein [Lachnospiraceae bacterium]|nr:four-carbon acid sugar kinase family protein [Lachnospiraceae bacterium]